MEGIKEDEEEEVGRHQLPSDAIFEILIRVPLEALIYCKCAFRDMRRITNEPAFTLMHTNRISGCFVQSYSRLCYSTTFVPNPLSSSRNSPSLSLDFLPEPVKIMAVSNHRGLVCCSTGNYRSRVRYYVCKPASRQWRAIPNPRTRFEMEKMEIVARPNGLLDYKIIRFSKAKGNPYWYHLEVFDSRKWAWSRSKDVELPTQCIVNHKPSVLVDGVLHWVTSEDNIFAFDVRTENWMFIAVPPLPERWRLYDRITGCEGKLWLLAECGEQMVMWTMARRGQEIRWESKGTVNTKAVRMKEEGTSFLIETLYNSQVAIMRSAGVIIWFDFQNEKVMSIKTSRDGIEGVYMFESDDNPCELDSRVVTRS